MEVGKRWTDHKPKKKRGCYTSLYDWYDRARAVQGFEIPFGFFASPDANMYRRKMMRYVICRLFPFESFLCWSIV
jgi:hypothetical protein